MAIDQTIMDRFKGELGRILHEELAAGNGIFDTWFGDFPYPDCFCICLTKPFFSKAQHDLPGIRYGIPTEHHHWKEEYYDPENHLVLCCMFNVTFGSW